MANLRTLGALSFIAMLGCTTDPVFESPNLVSDDQDAGGAGTAGAKPLHMDLVAPCDEAANGTACGTPARYRHCIDDVCALNVCGDGVRAEAEGCDDGNQLDGDACNRHCESEPTPSCGDGRVNGDEQCDDGNRDDQDDCTGECRYARCGDGHVGPGEECDDENRINSDNCLNTCMFPDDAGA